jgi:D-glycero-D-manno-heptose 1,7-bisphosphate phosphatase
VHIYRKRFVLLDRDGVINHRIKNSFVTSWQDFTFLPEALTALRLLSQHGYMVALVSNQAGVGIGMMNANDLQKLTQRFLLEVALAGGNIGSVYYCTHAPGDGCLCRTPMPGLLLRAMAEHNPCPASTYMVGDSLCDMEAASRAGCRGILLQRDAFLYQRMPCKLAKRVVSNLLEAAQRIIQNETYHDYLSPAPLHEALEMKSA